MHWVSCSRTFVQHGYIHTPTTEVNAPGLLLGHMRAIRVHRGFMNTYVAVCCRGFMIRVLQCVQYTVAVCCSRFMICLAWQSSCEWAMSHSSWLSGLEVRECVCVCVCVSVCVWSLTLPLHHGPTMPKVKRQETDRLSAASWFLHQLFKFVHQWCNTLQLTATRCNTLQHITPATSMMQHTATHCNTL